MDIGEASNFKFTYKKTEDDYFEERTYQITLLTMVLLKELHRIEKYHVFVQNDGRNNLFNDGIIESSDGDTFFQIKYTKNKTKVSLRELLSINYKDDFSLSKLFFSYVTMTNKFNIDTIFIYTNRDMESTKEVKKYSLDKKCCFEEFANTVYILDENINMQLKQTIHVYYNENYQKDIPKDVLSDENIRKFLGCLKFVVGSPSIEDLHIIVQKAVLKIEYLDRLNAMEVFNFLYTKIQNCISQENGYCITNNQIKAFLCDYFSNKYCTKFEKLDIYFNNNDLAVRDCEKQLVHIVVNDDYIVAMLKLYRFLKKTEEKHIWMGEECSEDIKLIMMDVFQMDSYNHLVIASPDNCDNFISENMCNKIRNILEMYKTKKVFLVFHEGSRIVEYFKRMCDCGVVEQKLKYSEFDENTRKKIRSKSVVFQGREVELSKLLWLSDDEDINEFLDADTLMKLILDKNITVGYNIDELKGDLKEYYIPRTFKSESGSISEEKLCELNEKIVLISDSPGMGKSTVLTNLCSTIKTKYPYLWVIKLDINNYTNILFEFREKKRQSITVRDLLNSKKTLTVFENKAFSLPRKVVFMIDGVDEVSPDYKELTINLIKDCEKKQNFAKIYVTTRPHLRDELQKELEVKNLTLIPFSQSNQVEFLTRYWTKRLDLPQTSRCQIYAQKLIKEIAGWLNDEQSNALAEIPLQTRMLAEVFQENTFSWAEWQGCHEFLTSEDEEPRLPQKINLVKLYRLFMSKKVDIFMYDKTLLTGNIVVTDALRKVYDECRVYHQLLALDVVLGEYSKVLNYYNILLEKNLEDKHVVMLGIVEKVGGQYKFIHRTFAEYFAAECLIKELKSDNQNKRFQEFFVSEVLTNYRYQVERSFLNDFLQEEQELTPITFSYTRDLLSTTRILQGLIEEGCIHLLRFFLKCSENSFEVSKMRGGAGKTLLHYACRGHLDIAKLLVEDGADINAEDFSGDSPLHDAVSKDRLDVVTFLLDKGANINGRGRDGRSALYSAVQNINLEMVKLLLERGADIAMVDKYGRTALHRVWDIQFTNDASKRDYLEMVELLLDSYSNVDNKYVETILHVLARVGNFNFGHMNRERLKSLLDDETCNADIDVGDINGKTPLHKASEKGHLEVAAFLIENGATVDARNRNGDTPLHAAAAKNHLDIIQALVDANGEVNATNNNGRTALHCCGISFEVMKFLVEKGLNVNIKDDLNALTVLHYGVLLGENFVRFLVEAGADVNVKDKSGKTLLHYAAPKNDGKPTYYLMTAEVSTADSQYSHSEEMEQEKCRVFEYLLGSNIDVNAKDDKGLTVLHELCDSSRTPLELVEALLDKGAEINRTDKKKRTALYYSIMRNSLDVAKVLIVRGADVNVIDVEGSTPLHKVSAEIESHKHKPNILKMLVNNGADVNISDKNGSTALHILCSQSNTQIVCYLLENKADVNIIDKEGNTALHIASQKNSLDIVRCLIAKGSNIRAMNYNRQSPLHLALSNLLQNKRFAEEYINFVHLVKFIVENGADINAKDTKGRTALHIASSFLDKTLFTLHGGSEDIVQVLVKNGSNVNVADEDGVTALHIASKLDNLDSVCYLIENKANINAKNKNGNTALHESAISHSMDVLEYLIAKRADLNAKNEYGQTCLHVIMQRKNLDDNKYTSLVKMVSLLLKNGIEVDSRDLCGRTALHVAASTSILDKTCLNQDYKNVILQILLENKAAINSADENGSTALHISSRWNSLPNVCYLLENEANINAEDKYGNTALHDAIVSNSRDVVKGLLQRGVNVNARNKEGQTALHLAVQQDHLDQSLLDVMRVLIENGADVNSQDAAHHTVLFTAISAGRKDTVRLLAESGAELCGGDATSMSLNGDGKCKIDYLTEDSTDRKSRCVLWFYECFSCMK